MKIKLYLISLFLVACGKIDLPAANIDSAFDPFIKNWEETYGIKVTVNVLFGELPDKIAGQCFLKTVTINKKYWDEYSYYGKEQLLFHEFGHCLMNLGHDRTTVKNSDGLIVPKSFMWPYTFGDRSYYKGERDRLIEELRTSSASELARDYKEE